MRPRAMVLGTLAALAGAGSAHAESVTRTSEGTTATLSWKQADIGVTDPRLRVERAGTVVLDVSLADVCRGCLLIEDALHLADLTGDDDPEVLVDTYSGGAHCCTTMRTFGRRPGETAWRRLPSWAWGNAGYVVRDIDRDGRDELSGRDDQFAYAFGSSYAGSAAPPKVVGGLPLRDITRRFPSLIRADAAQLLKRIRSVRSPRSSAAIELGSPLAAYALEQAQLGRPGRGLAEVRRARRLRLVPAGLEKAIRRSLRRNGFRVRV